MFVVRLGFFYMFLLCCCSMTEAKGSLVVKDRTSVALAGETLSINIEVTVPVNISGTTVSCSRDKRTAEWSHTFDQIYPTPTLMLLSPNITMHNRTYTGEYHCKYQEETCYWVVLVRDVGYVDPDVALDSDVIALLTVTLILLIFSIIGSVYICKWHKDHPQTKESGEEVKGRERQSNVGVTTQGANAESVYTSLEPRPVSIYDVLKVDQARRESMEKHTSQETAKTSHAEEGIFESVYENL
ncbi:NFAT activation molecule 1 [Salminus brasiliensis]|uniref:NFAT activation molecule 1 n=1 Tax=Salminus brasiliensis TaxID=930266 RepID=UPI003B832884